MTATYVVLAVGWVLFLGWALYGAARYDRPPARPHCPVCGNTRSHWTGCPNQKGDPT